MSGSGVVVAVDQGGHATRAVAFDATGRRLAAASVEIDTRHGPGGQVEHDGEQVVESVLESLARLGTQVAPGTWTALGLGVQRSSIACWDRATGELLSPVISWQDRRQAGWLEQFASRAGQVHATTGLPLSPHYGASKLRWCLDHLPAVREAADRGRLCAGPLASLLLARLLDGRPCLADESNASRTQLWSPRDRAWSPALLDLFGVPASVLPRLVPTRARFGLFLSSEGRVPVCACTGDQAAVPFAGGPLDDDTAYVNLGTGAFVLRPAPQPFVAAPLLTSVLDSDAGQVTYALEGTVNGAGSALDWFGQHEGIDAHAMLPQLDTLPGTGGPLFLNGIAGVGSPFWIPQFDSRFVGEGDRLSRLRAVVESIAFLLRANLEVMAPHAGRPSRIVASGGLSRCGPLLAALASLAGVAVERLDDPEATSRGVAFLAAGKPAGWDALRGERKEAVRSEVLEARYRRWLGLMRSG